MKFATLLLGSICVLSASAARADDPSGGTLVLLSGAQVFAPKGFDDNDQTVVVLDGAMPSTCYKIAHSEAVPDADGKGFQLRQWARRYPGVCLDLVVPYTTEVPLGILPHGSFRLSAPGVAAQTLDVSEATNAGPDDHLYASVDTVRIEPDVEHQRYLGILQGRFTNTCLKWDDVQLIDSGRTLEVLPIVSMKDGPDCRAAELRFSWMLELPATMTPGRHLLHVRSMNGKSANAMFTVDAPVR
jgi:hypothetical protein